MILWLYRPKNRTLKFYFVQWYNLQILGISGNTILGVLATTLLIKASASAWHTQSLSVLAHISFLLSNIKVLAACSLSTPWHLICNRLNSTLVSTDEIWPSSTSTRIFFVTSLLFLSIYRIFLYSSLQRMNVFIWVYSSWSSSPSISYKIKWGIIMMRF